jgi:hypothetical protein
MVEFFFYCVGIAVAAAIMMTVIVLGFQKLMGRPMRWARHDGRLGKVLPESETHAPRP